MSNFTYKTFSRGRFNRLAVRRGRGKQIIAKIQPAIGFFGRLRRR